MAGPRRERRLVRAVAGYKRPLIGVGGAGWLCGLSPELGCNARCEGRSAGLPQRACALRVLLRGCPPSIACLVSANAQG